MKRLIMLATIVFAALGLASFAAANTVSSITFGTDQGYAVGNINGQPSFGDTWTKTGPYDANVVNTSRFDVGGQALQISNAITSGRFGDQTFSPGVDPAGVGTALPHFTASFQIGTALSTQQTGLAISVSPDNGSGARMSYLRFEDQTNGVHVFFDQSKGSTFKESDIAILDRTSAHTIGFSIGFTAPSSKAVTVTIDGAVKAIGATWASYYQTQEHNPTPTVSKMLFRAGGTEVAPNLGNGFLIDNVTLASS